MIHRRPTVSRFHARYIRDIRPLRDLGAKTIRVLSRYSLARTQPRDIARFIAPFLRRDLGSFVRFRVTLTDTIYLGSGRFANIDSRGLLHRRLEIT